MNLTEIVRKLKAINYALENLEVKGRENLDILLGSMQEIDRVVNELQNGMRELNASQPVSVQTKLITNENESVKNNSEEEQAE